LRLLANENFPRVAIEALRNHGHDVLWMRTHAPGSSDAQVLGLARSGQRLLITFDKDFGELAFHSRLPAECGIVLFRIFPNSPEYVARTAVTVLESRSDWAGHFSVVEEHRIRMVSLSS
jgi:predicted nuclease of predicted toxin-antitoxin system